LNINAEKEWKGQKEIRVTGHRKSEKRRQDKTGMLWGGRWLISCLVRFSSF
jgi:hypothetical protein